MTDASATPHTASDAEILAAFHDEATDLLAANAELWDYRQDHH